MYVLIRVSQKRRAKRGRGVHRGGEGFGKAKKSPKAPDLDQIPAQSIISTFP